MPRRPAQITQADIARVLRAAKQVGTAEVDVPLGDRIIRVRLTPATDPFPDRVPDEEVIL
jgi:hypothetical protein